MTTLFGIKNCDSVRKARKWLDEKGIEYQFHDFRIDGLTEEMVNQWLLQQPLEKLINKRSTSWKQLDEDEKSLLDASSAAAIAVKHETLIKRPVLAINGDIHLGFSDKLYSTIFSHQ